jgi:hypothetical protein
VFAVDVSSVDGEDTKGVATVENARCFFVHAAVYEEEAKGGGDGAVIRRVEIDGLGED